MSTETDLYGYEEITALPPAMNPWEMRLKLSARTQYGEYVLVGCQPATEPQHHQVIVLGEDKKPLVGVRVVFRGGDTTFPSIGLPSGKNYWSEMAQEVDIRGYEYTTDANGLAWHTTGYPGGEFIFIWNIETNGELKLSSTIVENCRVINTSTYQLHGVRLTYQRRRVTTYQVRGTVKSRKGANVAGLRVVVVDKTATGDVTLVETSTRAGGAYQASFTDEGLRLRGRAQPDVQARVFAGAKLAGFSVVRYNATTSETLDVLLNDGIPDDAGRQAILRAIDNDAAKLEQERAKAQQLVDSLRAAQSELNQERAQTEGREQYLAQLALDIQAAQAAGNAAEVKRLQAWRAELTQFFQQQDIQIAKKQADLDALFTHAAPIEVRLAALRAQQEENYAALLGDFSTEVPMVLLPVRLETRFKTVGNQTDLLIRVYPDAIHVDAHLQGLTDAEVTWGQHFWRQINDAAATDATRDAAWRQLAEKFGAGRAAWIAEATRPGHTPTRRSDDQWIPPRARALPDYWLALGYLDGQRVLMASGKNIADALVVGPTGKTTAPGAAPGLAATEDMYWMLDFDAALAAGMALRVPLTTDPQRGLDRLIVVGVKATLSGAQSAAHLAELLTAHRYTRGLAFVPQGTPTNNTSDAPSGFDSRAAPPAMAPYAPAMTLAPSDDGARTAAALRLPAAFFARTPHANGQEQTEAGAMNTALWPATWGYYLEQFMGGALSVPIIEEQRRHFTRYVRGRGPLPALRVGEQPYGLLPATAIDRWSAAATAGATTGLASLLRNLRDTWRRSAALVPLLQQDGDLDHDLAEVLALDAISHAYTVRPLFGGDFATNVAALLNNPQLRGRWTTEAGRVQELLLGFGLKQPSRLARAAFVFQPYPFGQALVQEDGNPSNPHTASNYIQRLLDSTYEGIRSGYGLAEPLLYLLLRHAALLAFDAAARRLASQYGLAGADQGREAELVDFDATSSTSTPWRRLERNVPALGMTAGAYLDRIKQDPTKVVPAAREATVAFLEFWESLRRLASRPADALERAMAETLDLSSHRLDAWITSFATERLASLSRNEIAIGGYGWLVDVRPGDATDSRGFIQAPSLAQAATAAVLRNGYLAYGGVTNANPLAVDLSSARVRLATWFLEGVRQGQSLGALLGYRFERRLHERQLDQYIRPFRLVAPLAAMTDDPRINDITDRWIELEDRAANADLDANRQESVKNDLEKKRNEVDPQWPDSKAHRVVESIKEKQESLTGLVAQIKDADAKADMAEAERVRAQDELSKLPPPTNEWEPDPPNKPKRVSDPNATQRLSLRLAIASATSNRDYWKGQSQIFQNLHHSTFYILWKLYEAKTRNEDDYTYWHDLFRPANDQWLRLTRIAKVCHRKANHLLATLDPQIQTKVRTFKKVRDLRVTIDELASELESLQGPDGTKGAIAAKNSEISQAEKRLSDATGKVRTLERELFEVSAEITRASLEVDTLEGQLVDPGPLCELVGNRIVCYKPEKDGGSKNQMLRTRIANARKVLESAQETLSRKQAELGDEKDPKEGTARKEVKDASDNLQALQKELKKLTDRVENINGADGELPKKRDELAAELVSLDPPQATLDSIPAHDVVDGWELLDRWQRGLVAKQWDNTTIPFGKLNLPTSGVDYEGLRAELAALADAADAVSDLVTAESVYQMVQGNTMRAGATLNAVASGETLPEYEVIRTPRSGVVLTHRLAMLWSGPAPATPAWSPRAQAEPRLNQWAGQVLGDLSQVVFSARAVKHGTDEKVIPPTQLSLGQLEMAPLDLIYAGEGSDEVKLAEIEQRAVSYFLKQHGSVTDPLDIYLDFDASRSALEAIFEASRAIHALLAAARPAESRVFSSLADPADPAGAELKQRTSVAVTGLQAAFDALPLEKEPDATTGAQALRERLLALASFGVPGAVPDSPPGDADAVRRALWQQAWGCRHEVERRLEQAQDIKPASQADCLAQLEAVFGRQFRVMPVFGPVAKLPEALGTATQQTENRREVVRWFQRVARVRDGAARLDAALMAAEAMNPAAPLDLRVFQFPPPAPTEKWGALARPAGGQVSVVAQVPPGFAPAGPVAGLIVDDWVEVVPGETETTGVAFHFDAPGAQPPQAILLAVPPAPPAQRPKWDMDTLADIVLETLELARLRTVTQETLGEIGQLLPASYFAFNLANDTVSTDFTGFEI